MEVLSNKQINFAHEQPTSWRYNYKYYLQIRRSEAGGLYQVVILKRTPRYWWRACQYGLRLSMRAVGLFLPLMLILGTLIPITAASGVRDSADPQSKPLMGSLLKVVPFGSSGIINAGMTHEDKFDIPEVQEVMYCGSSPKYDVLCGKSGALFFHGNWKSSPSEVISTGKIFICKDGKLMDTTCKCSLLPSDCFHSDTGCQTPKSIELPEASCTAEQWLSLAPTEICSREPGNNMCSSTTTTGTFSWVIDRNGMKKYVSELKIVTMQSSECDGYLDYGDPYVNPTAITVGDPTYCQRHGLTKDCFAEGSSKGRNLRHSKANCYVRYLVIGDCKEAIYCSGYERIIYYPALEKSPKQDPTVACPECSLSCYDDYFLITIPLKGSKLVDITGSDWTKGFRTEETRMEVTRSYRSRTLDAKIEVIAEMPEVWSGKLRLSSKCDIFEPCDAIRCWFCKERVMNVQCYPVWLWIVIGVCVILCWAVVLSVFGLCCAIGKTCCTITGTFLGITRWFVIKTGKIVSKVGRVTAHKMAERVQRFDEELSEAPLLANEESMSMRALPPASTRTSRHYSGLFGPQITLMKVIMIILVALPLVLCERRNHGLTLDFLHSKDNSTHFSSDCVALNMYYTEASKCDLTNNHFECNTEYRAKLPLVSLGAASCFLIMKGDVILGGFKVVTKDIYYQCEEEVQYYTRPHKMIMSHVIRCPSAGPCTEGWCAGIKDDTNVDGLTVVDRPKKTSCSLGDACWVNGCFYCTSSCHVIRYHAEPLTGDIIKVFKCPLWKPKANLEISFTSGLGHWKKEVIVNAKEAIKVQGVSFLVHFEDSNKLTELGKTFMSKGSKTAIVDASSKGSPEADKVGEIQCESAEMANKFTNSCIMARDICNCRPSADSDVCDCSMLNIDQFFIGSTALPRAVENYWFKMHDSKVTLHPPHHAAGEITIEGKETFSAPSENIKTCEIKITKVSGCYSCASGVTMKYICSSKRAANIIANCTGDLQIMLLCRSENTAFDVHFMYNSAALHSECTTPCSPKFTLEASLAYEPLREMASEVDISLLDSPVMEGFLSWLKATLSHVYYKWLLIIGVISLFLIGSCLPVCCLNCFKSPYRRLKRMD